MLEKDNGSPKLHRLRVIHLLEADLNLLIKIIIARRFVWHGETHGTFGEAQHPFAPSFASLRWKTTLPRALTACSHP